MKWKWVLITTSHSEDIPAHFTGQNLQAGPHLAMHSGLYESGSQTAQIKWLKENQWPSWILFTPVSAVSFIQKSEAATFPRIYGFQISKNVRQQEKNTAGFSSGSILSLECWSVLPRIPILIVPDSLLPPLKTFLVIFSGRWFYILVIRDIDLEVPLLLLS